jgi:hypothetical protein
VANGSCTFSTVAAPALPGSKAIAPPHFWQGRTATPKSPSIIPSRGLNIRQAAAYFGVSPNTFKKLVRLGLAPAPLKLPGLDRNIYDRQALDDAMSARAVGS